MSGWVYLCHGELFCTAEPPSLKNFSSGIFSHEKISLSIRHISRIIIYESFCCFFAVSDKLLVLILWVPIFILKILRQGNLHELMSI